MKVSLRVLLSVALILLTALPVVMFGIWAQKTTLEREYSRVQDTHLPLAKNISLALNRYAIDIKSTFQVFSGFRNEIDVEPGVVELANNLNFGFFRLQRKNGEVSFSYLFREGESVGIPQVIIDAAWKSEVGNEPSFHPVIIDSRSVPKIYLSQKVSDDQLAIADIYLDFFFEMQSLVNFGSSGHSVIVDQVGNLIAHPKMDWVVANKNIAQLEPVRAILKGKTGVAEFYSPAKLKDMISGYSVVPEVGWGVMIPQEISDLQEVATGVIKQLWLVLIIGIVLTAIFSWWLAGWIISPLKKITNTAHRMIKGELSARVLPFVNVPSDEFRELGVAFDQMAQSLQNNNARLQIKLETQKLKELQNSKNFADQNKILVIDDLPVNILKLTGWLSKAGYITFSAMTNEESLKIASVIRPELAIVVVTSSIDGGIQSRTKLIELLDGVGIPTIAIIEEQTLKNNMAITDCGAIVTMNQPVKEKKLLELVNNLYQARGWKDLDVKFVNSV